MIYCTAVKGKLETIREEDEEKGEYNDLAPEEEEEEDEEEEKVAAVAAPRFVPMTETLEGYFSNTAVLAAFQAGWLDVDSHIFRLHAFGLAGLRDFALCCHLATLPFRTRSSASRACFATPSSST